MKKRVKVTVKGIVQGVSYRYYTVQMAKRFNVKGWVRNLVNGDVQGCFEGEEMDVKALVDWCWTGPPHASVDEVIEEKGEYTGEFRDFQVR